MTVAAEKALAELTEVSSQIETAVVFDDAGKVLAASLDDERAKELVGTVRALVAVAEELAAGEKLAQVEVTTGTGTVFAVRGDNRTVAATTGRDVTAAVVMYDLRACVRAAEPKRRPRKKKEDDAA